MSEEAFKKGFEAGWFSHSSGRVCSMEHEMDEALKDLSWEAAPEAPKVEQEPVAWRYRSAERPHLGWTKPEYSRRSPHGRIGMDEQPLFTHPALASDELLEVLKLVDLSLQAMADEGIIADGSWSFVTDAIAKHKGPQS